MITNGQWLINQGVAVFTTVCFMLLFASVVRSGMNELRKSIQELNQSILNAERNNDNVINKVFNMLSMLIFERVAVTQNPDALRQLKEMVVETNTKSTQVAVQTKDAK